MTGRSMLAELTCVSLGTRHTCPVVSQSGKDVPKSKPFSAAAKSFLPFSSFASSIRSSLEVPLAPRGFARPECIQRKPYFITMKSSWAFDSRSCGDKVNKTDLSPHKAYCRKRPKRTPNILDSAVNGVETLRERGQSDSSLLLRTQVCDCMRAACCSKLTNVALPALPLCYGPCIYFKRIQRCLL